MADAERGEGSCGATRADTARSWGSARVNAGSSSIKLLFVVVMAGGGLSREILVSYVVISTSPTTNELYTTGRTEVIFVGHLWPSIFLNK